MLDQCFISLDSEQNSVVISALDFEAWEFYVDVYRW